jgi:23S rRNA (pseudouridine1915-N3)-methyltransferase
VGKKSAGEDWIAAGCEEYEKRLSALMTLQTHFYRNDDELLKAVKSISKGTIFALDERGKEYTSHQFTDVLYQKGFEEGGSYVHFIIGGAVGLPKEIKSSYPCVSLSKMTWTHQMARLLLIEQIYRATEIKKGSNYHKD